VKTRIHRFAQAMNGMPYSLAGLEYLDWVRMVVVLKGAEI